MGLDAELPLRMLETVLQSKPGVIGLIRSVHGLQVEVLEFQLFEALRQSAFLRKYQLELTPTPYQKLGARFGTYTDPIDAFWNRLGSVRLHGDHETLRMKRCDQGLIELKKWFPASADNESPRPRRAIGRLTRTPHPSTWETTASAIKPEFARIMQVEERLRAGKKDQLSARRWGELEFRTTVLMGAPDVLDTYSGFRAWFGIETRDPTSDRRVVEFCFAIPGFQYLRNGVTFTGGLSLIASSCTSARAASPNVGLPTTARVRPTLRISIVWVGRVAHLQDPPHILSTPIELPTARRCRRGDHGHRAAGIVRADVFRRPRR